MSTWGQKKFHFSKYYPEDYLYYEYQTVTDSYYFKLRTTTDYGLGPESFEQEIRINDEEGKALLTL